VRRRVVECHWLVTLSRAEPKAVAAAAAIQVSRESKALGAAAELYRYGHLSFGNLSKNCRDPASQRRTPEIKSPNGVQSPRLFFSHRSSGHFSLIPTSFRALTERNLFGV
jgi:hypothetical protein